jgi:hypothetical protein
MRVGRGIPETQGKGHPDDSSINPSIWETVPETWEIAMIRQYGAQRSRGGDNPLRVGIIAVGSIYYLQDEGFFRDRYGGRAVCRTPWIVEAFLNGTMGAARRHSETGLWEDVYLSGRSDMALVRSLRDRRRVQQVAVRTLSLHDELGLWKQPTLYPTLPDVKRYRPTKFKCDVATPPQSGRRKSRRLTA